MALANGHVYTMTHTDLYKMPYDFEYDFQYSVNRVKHDRIFRSKDNTLLDFAFLPNKFQVAVLSKSFDLIVIDQFSSDVIYQTVTTIASRS